VFLSKYKFNIIYEDDKSNKIWSLKLKTWIFLIKHKCIRICTILFTRKWRNMHFNLKLTKYAKNAFLNFGFLNSSLFRIDI